MTCMLSDLKLPEPDVRLVVYNNTVVKVKLRCRNAQVSGETNQDSLKFWSRAKIQSDIKRAMTYVLSGIKKIEPIRTDELVIYPYKRDWPNASKFEFVRQEEVLGCSKDLYMFFIERIEVKQVNQKKAKTRKNERCEEKTPVNSPSQRVGDSSKSTGKRSLQIRSSSTSLRRSVGPLRKRKRRFPSEEEDIITDKEDSLDSSDDDVLSSESEDEEKSPAKDPGVIMSILGYLFTPVKSIRRIWR